MAIADSGRWRPLVPGMATAILDRLLHHASTLNIKGESYRLNGKRRAGLLGRAKPATAPEKEALTDNETE